jgi:hypothetical protein
MYANNSSSTISINATLPSRADSLSAFMLITYVYLIPIIACIGFILNLICFVVLFHPKLMANAYKYLIFKTIAHLTTLALTCLSPLIYCSSCQISTSFGAQIIRIYFLIFLNNSSYTLSGLIEIALAYNRIALFRKSSKWSINISLNSLLAIFLVASFIINLPNLFANVIINRQPGVYLTIKNEFGISTWFKIYTISLNFIHTFLAFVILVVLNSLVVFEFKKYMYRRNNLIKLINVTKSKMKSQARNSEYSQSALAKIEKARKKEKNSHKRIKKAELNFTVMTCFCSMFFTISRFALMIFAITSQIFPFDLNNVGLFNTYFSVIVYSFQLIYFSSSFFIYLTFNKKFRHCFKTIFIFSILY